MTPILTWTVATALLIAVMWAPYIIDRIVQNGLGGALKAGADTAAASTWGSRCHRAHIVAVESFTAFAPVAIIASMQAPESNGGLAMVYFFALLAHYIVYWLGIPVVRTLAFAVCSLCTVIIALGLLGIV